MVWLSHPYMTTGKTIALTIWIFVGKVMSLFFNMLSRFVVAFAPRSKHLLISWLQSPSAIILEPKKIKCITVCTVSPFICHEVMGLDSNVQEFSCVFVFKCFNWRIIALQNFVVFCHTSTRISHRYMHVTSFPNLPFIPISIPPFSLSQSPCLSSLSHIANSCWLSILHMVLQISMLLSPYISPWMLSFKPAFSLSLSSRGSLVPLCFLPQDGVICVYEIIDISPCNLDSSLCFI